MITTENHPRYVVTGTDIFDHETGLVAKFQNSGVAQIGADWLNGPDATPEDYQWEDQVPTVADLAKAARRLGVSVETIAPDQWATETSIDDEDGTPWVSHSREIPHDLFTATVAHAHTDVDWGTDVTVRWNSAQKDGLTNWEEFAVNATDLPELIAVLTEARDLIDGQHKPDTGNLIRAADMLGLDSADLAGAIEPLLRKGAISNATRPLRRTADVDERLRELDN